MEKPAIHKMSFRAYLVDGEHVATVRGWWEGSEWVAYTSWPPECKTCALSAMTARALHTMASTGGRQWTVDGTTIAALR